MSRRAAIVSATVIVSALVALGCAEPESVERETGRPPTVAVVRGQARFEEPAIETFGSLSFLRSNAVTTEIGGTIVDLTVDEGDQVSGRQILAELENVQLRIREQQAEVGLQQAQAAVSLARAELRQGERSVEARMLGIERTALQLEQRRRELAETQNTLEEQQLLLAVDGISEEAVEQTELEYYSRQSSVSSLEIELSIARIGFRDTDVVEYLGRAPRSDEERRRALVELNTETLQARVRTAEAQLALAEAELEGVLDLISRLTITAPSNGVVAARSGEVGDVVTEGTPLYTLIDEDDTLYAVVALPETDAPFVERGQAAVVTVPVLGDGEFEGNVALLSPVLDPQTGSRTVRVRIPRSDSRLLPGLFVRVRIPTAEPALVTTIPASALRSRDGESAQVLVVESGRVFVRDIEVRDGQGIEDDRVVVTGGLESGEPVVDRPSDTLQEGQEVAIDET